MGKTMLSLQTGPACCPWRPLLGLTLLGGLLAVLMATIPLACVAALPAIVDVPAPAAPEGTVAGKQGMVVCVSPPSAEIGCAILQKGGNAVDAAVAVAFAEAVTWPQAGNLGGGGFMVIYPGHGAEPVVIDYRETAPLAATKTMYGKNDGWYGHRTVGVPGTVSGLALAHGRFGKLPWKEVVQPALRLAEEGFAMDEALASSLNSIVLSSSDFPELCRVYGRHEGSADWKAGDRILQKDLAWSLRHIAEEGADAFYKGPIADKLAVEMKSGNGLITKEDLAAYHAKERKAVHGTYRGYDVYGAPPPSSGGICLIEMLNILENVDLKKQGRWSAETLHLMTEAMRRAYCDRARHLGDQEFVKIPSQLTSKQYARQLAAQIDLKKATKSEALAPDLLLGREGDSTTHFSVIDRNGMGVSNTYTLERSYGSRVVVKGAGFLLNNEMMDFNWQPGVTDQHGTIGTEPNQIAPGKRMLSSQSPTIVARDGKIVLITGSPGSRTIINTVLCVVLNVLEFDMNIREAVDAPRQHHPWFPDIIRFEGVSQYPDTVAKLKGMGHSISGTRQGDAHSIYVDPKTGTYYGAADRRIDGKAAGY